LTERGTGSPAEDRGISRVLRTTARSLALCALLALGCSDPPTRLVVEIDADDAVRAQARSVWLRIAGGDPPTRAFEEARDARDLDWPAHATIVPEGGDASRQVRVDVEALDAAGRPIAAARATTGYVAHETRVLRLRLDTDACMARDCGAPWADPHQLPVLAPDAGATGTDAACGSAREACEGVRDDDCDGRVDEGCACSDGATRACGTDVGECRAGTERCASGVWGACEGGESPRAEDCDGRDDDCDGRTDEALADDCREDGCRGARTCTDGDWGACIDDEGRDCDAQEND
jgi:hypothetical protein